MLRRFADIECDGLEAEALALTLNRMELYDGLPPQGRALVQEFGMKLGMDAARQFYGRWDEARAYCESVLASRSYRRI